MKEEQTISELPKDWSLKKLGDVCLKVEQVKRKAKDQDEELLYLDIGGIDNASNRIVSHKKYKWSDAPSRAQQIVQKGDILFSTVRTYLKNIAQVENEIYNGQIASSGFCIIRANEEMDPKFLFYLSLSERFLRPLNDLQTGSSYPAVRDKDVFNQLVPKPPKDTQLQIVSKIEELFSELDKGIDELKTAQQQLAAYRKSILFDGVVGKLTEGWRKANPEIKSSEVVFKEIQSLLDKVFKEACEQAAAKGKRKPKDQRQNKKTFTDETHLPDLPSGWNYYRLEEITYLVTDGTHFTPKYQESGVKFLSVKNVRPFYFKEEHLKYISEKEHQSLIERCKPEKNDILYTKVGATYGYAAKVTMDYEFSIFVSLCLIKPVHEYVSSDFLEIVMNSELVFQQARRRVSGSGVPDLHLIEIRDFKIPLPTVDEQQQIVLELESRLSVCDKIEETITDSLKQAEALRQSILKKAFEGKL